MKTLTIKNPFASLIVNGYKDVENRSWKTNYRGTILIHSSMKDDEGVVFPEMSSPTSPNGAIIGQVDVVDCLQNHTSKWAMPNYWHWVLENPVKYGTPILNVKGKLSLWEHETFDEMGLRYLICGGINEKSIYSVRIRDKSMGDYGGVL